MKRFLILIVLSGIFVISAMAQYVTLQGRQFKDEHGNDFYPVVDNYIVTFIYDPVDSENFFPTPEKEVDQWCYDCSSFNLCLDQIYSNLQRLKTKNFNTIRLFGLQPIFCDIDNLGHWGWKINAVDCKRNPCSEHQIDKDYYILSNPIKNDPVAQKIFQFIDSILVKADSLSMKVILLCGGSKGWYNNNFPTEYALYLDALSDHIAHVSPQKARNALMAYDLFNEPLASWDDRSLWPNFEEEHTKKDVCEHVANWYDVIKQNDPEHLITFGGTFNDIFEFDPGVLKIDFYSPHIYTAKLAYETNNIWNMLGQAIGKFYDGLKKLDRNLLTLKFLSYEKIKKNI